MMNIECKIQAFLVKPGLFGKVTDDIETWYDIEPLYTVTEVIDIPEECLDEIIEEQKVQVAPQVYFKYMTGGDKWSKLERINHRKEVEHRAKFQQRLVDSGRFTDENIKELTDRFYVMVYPAYDLSKPQKQEEQEQEVIESDVINNNPNCFTENGILFERLEDGTKVTTQEGWHNLIFYQSLL